MENKKTLYQLLNGKKITNVYDRGSSVLIRFEDRTELLIEKGLLLLEEEEISIGNPCTTQCVAVNKRRTTRININQWW